MVVGLLVASILAGCATKETRCGEGTSCASQPTNAPVVPTLTLPPPRGNLTLPNATYPNFQMTGCEDYSVGTELPTERVRPLVPDAFDLWGATNGNPTTGALIVILSCQRTLDNSSVFGAGTLYGVYIRATPKNESWTEEGIPNFYLMDMASDNDDLIRAAANVSLHVSKASVSATKIPTPDGSQAVHWTVEAGPWSAMLDIGNPKQSPPQNVDYEFHYWYGKGPFSRVSYHDKGTSTGLVESGSFTLQGNAEIAPAMAGPTVPFVGNYFVDKNALFQYDGAWNLR